MEIAVSSPSEFLLIIFAAWIAIGATLAVVMGRRGHGAFQWLFLGCVLGPLSLPIAWASIRDEDRRAARPLEEGTAGVGPVDVLVGIDGSPGSSAALRTVVEMIGPNVGRLTLAAVVTLDEGSVQAARDDEKAVGILEAAARSVPNEAPGRVVLSGQPAGALIRYAQVEGYGLLVIGRRGRGATKALLGSTADRIADGPVPALIV